MGSILFFLFFIQTMVLFEPLNSPDQKSGEGRHGFGGSNATCINFPLDLDLPSLKKESEEKETTEEEKAPKRASDKAKQEMNLDLSLNSDVKPPPPRSSSSSSVKALNNGRVSSAPAVKIINRTAVKKTVTHKKETTQNLVMMGCLTCQVYVMTPWQRVCPSCQSPGLVDVKTLLKKTAVKKEIKREEVGIKNVLVAMGCHSCYLYFMGIKEKPVCPSCNNNQSLIGLNLPSKM